MRIKRDQSFLAGNTIEDSIVCDWSRRAGGGRLRARDDGTNRSVQRCRAGREHVAADILRTRVRNVRTCTADHDESAGKSHGSER